MITIHLWGHDSTRRPSLISPESIALFWYLKAQTKGENHFIKPGQTIELVFSNNITLSPNYHLPLLIDQVEEANEEANEENSATKEKTVVVLSGYDNIIRYLTGGNKRDDYDNDNNNAVSNALLQFVSDEIGSLTDWALYIDSNNYNKFTKPEYSQLLTLRHWPMNSLCGAASARAAVKSRLRLSNDSLRMSLDNDSINVTEEEAETAEAEDLAHSKVFKLRAETRRRVKRELQELKDKVSYSSRLVKLLQQWREVATTTNTPPPSPSRAARLLLLAHLHVQLSLPDTATSVRDRLTTEFITTTGETGGAEFVKALDDVIDQLWTASTTSSSTVCRTPHYWNEEPNAVASALRWCHRRWSNV